MAEQKDIKGVTKLEYMDKKIIMQSIAHYGQQKQAVVCMEECSELIQAISKELRGKSDLDHLTEEMADVAICLEMMKLLFNIKQEDIDIWVKLKQKRMQERMKEGV